MIVVLLSSVSCFIIDMNDIRLLASLCRGLGVKAFISSKKPELIARAFLWALVLRNVVVIDPSLPTYLFKVLLGRLACRAVPLIVALTFCMTAALFWLWVGFHSAPTLLYPVIARGSLMMSS